jgi:polysaccharide pyruvyl transferase WcaK-like protein
MASYRPPFRSAVILNFTASTYHWGCYGTSMEILETLRERGYFVNWLTVETTHHAGPTPNDLASYEDPAFARGFFGANREILLALQHADVVVINGEGTLHRLGKGPRNLLYLAHAARRFLSKPVHLINHSFFPAGDEAPAEAADALYSLVARGLDHVVPREALSKAVLDRLGVASRQGFDCLPRFIARVGTCRPAGAAGGPILLSGGVTLDERSAERLGQALAAALPAQRPVRFLTGAKSAPAREDASVFAQIRSQLPRLELRTAVSVEAWLEEIAGAACLISARFHHSLAAASLGTPLISFPSNTPKVEAALSMLGLPEPLRIEANELGPELTGRVAAALAGEEGVAADGAVADVRELAAANFIGL